MSTISKNKLWIIRAAEMLAYLACYVFCFGLVESRDVVFYNIHCRLDDIIPFCEYFIIPYFMWFGYVAVTLIYFAFADKAGNEYFAVSRSIAVGCTLFIIVSFLFPNGQTMRPEIVGDTFFKKLVLSIYSIDTATNIFPSIHVYNSIACHVAWHRSPIGKKYPVVKILSFIIAASITLSTVFLKQHSVIDMIGAFVLNIICFIVFYVLLYKRGVINK